MTKKALQFDACDNVAVALEAMNAGDSVIINGEGPEVKIVQSLPQGHKFAVRPIKCGETVVKYGHSIGTAVCDIEAGNYVHTHNLSDPISNWKENYLYEFDPEPLSDAPRAAAMSFTGISW